jgi:iron-sulfur cluster insertion protein
MAGCTKYVMSEDNSALAPVIFTQNAAKKVAEIIQEENNPALKLRVHINGGGCAGLQYEFSLEEDIREDDESTTTDGVMLLIKKKAFKYLAGSIIDYVNDLEGERFTIQNPNATKTCGCGTSFDIAEEAA